MSDPKKTFICNKCGFKINDKYRPFGKDTQCPRCMPQNKIIQAIERIPNDGWWREHSKETFIKLIKELINNGFSLENAENFLTTAYIAVAAEYGD